MTAAAEAVPELFVLASSGATHAFVRRVLELVDSGRSPDDVVAEVLAPVQVEAGRRWQDNELTVADEHAVTATVDAALGALAALARPSRRRTLGRVAVVCAEGEWHVLPARMAAERLRWRGWDVLFLGGSVPAADLAPWLARTRPDVVAISCSVALHLDGVLRIAQATADAGLVIVAGGRGTGAGATRCHNLGIRWAGDVDGLQAAMDAPLPRTDPATMYLRRAECDDLLADADDIVEFATRALEERLPMVHQYSPAQHASMVADLHYIVRFLAVSVLAGDQGLFTEFVAWLRAVLSVRGVPVQALAEALDVLTDALFDDEGAAAHLAAALITLN